MRTLHKKRLFAVWAALALGLWIAHPVVHASGARGGGSGVSGGVAFRRAAEADGSRKIHGESDPTCQLCAVGRTLNVATTPSKCLPSPAERVSVPPLDSFVPTRLRLGGGVSWRGPPA